MKNPVLKPLPSSPVANGKDSIRRSPRGPLFLGHKVLGELRILMRLASNRAHRTTPYSHEQSF
jgi:hypothetical protein